MPKLTTVLLQGVLRALILASGICGLLWFLTDKSFLFFFLIGYPLLQLINSSIRFAAWRRVKQEVEKLQRFVSCSDHDAFEAIFTHKIFDEVTLARLEKWQTKDLESWLWRKRTEAAYRKGDTKGLRKHLPG